jgi:hypothetical protein
MEYPHPSFDRTYLGFSNIKLSDFFTKTKTALSFLNQVPLEFLKNIFLINNEKLMIAQKTVPVFGNKIPKNLEKVLKFQTQRICNFG